MFPRLEGLRAYLNHGNREEFEAKLKAVWKPEMAKCKAIPDFDEKIGCMAEVVHGISESQDIANLTVRGMFLDSDPQTSRDRRWHAANILDDANAMYLGITNARYDPEYFTRPGDYVKRKFETLSDKWRHMMHMKTRPEGYIARDETVEKADADWKKNNWHIRTDEEREQAIEEFGREKWEKLKGK